MAPDHDRSRKEAPRRLECHLQCKRYNAPGMLSARPPGASEDILSEDIVMLQSAPDLSKARLFSVKDATIVVSDQSASASGKSDWLPKGPLGETITKRRYQKISENIRKYRKILEGIRKYQKRVKELQLGSIQEAIPPA
jgi:hypothetical protein